MPELPEVETVRRALEPALAGRTFASVEQRRADLRFPFPANFVDRVAGADVQAVRRRAKYLMIDLSRGETLIVHLGMSGRITVVPHKEPARAVPDLYRTPPHDAATALGPHDHVVFTLDDGTTIIFNDHRRFGFMDLAETATLETCRHFLRMGPEPLGNRFSPAHLDSALFGKATPIKAALLDQRIVAGLGNIYVCEALYRAEISPRRLARSVRGKRVARLVPAIRDVLTQAIAAGGSSLRDYAHTDGSLGYFQHTFSVYDREGEPCPRTACGGTVRRIVQSGRSTFYCGRCQR